MRIAMVAFEGFTELDTFVTLGLLNRLRHLGWSAQISSPIAQVTSANVRDALPRLPAGPPVHG